MGESKGREGFQKKEQKPETSAKSRLEKLRDQAGHPGQSSSPPLQRRDRRVRSRSPQHDPILAHRGSVVHQSGTDNNTEQINDGAEQSKPEGGAERRHVHLAKPRKRMSKVSRISPKAQFKRIVRLVINSNMFKEQGDDGSHKSFGSQKKGKEQLFFDKNQFKASNKSRGLTSTERRILCRMPQYRTDEDLLILKGVVDRLKSFDKYTRKVKTDLSRVIFYENYNSGRYIIKQGHDGFSFYFIVSGKVQVRITDTDKATGEKTEHAVAEMSEGSSFGELALMHNIKRTATIVCIGHITTGSFSAGENESRQIRQCKPVTIGKYLPTFPLKAPTKIQTMIPKIKQMFIPPMVQSSSNGSEFLRVDRHDFEEVLRISTENEWTERLQCLKSQPCFADFSANELDSLNKHCKLLECPVGMVVIGNTKEAQDTMYFIASGICNIIRELTVVRERTDYGKEKLHLFEHLGVDERKMVPTKDIRQRRQAAGKLLKPETQLWHVGEVASGYYFGVGEDLTNTYVVAKNKVEILEVRRIKFVKNGRWKLAEKMRAEFDKAMPTNKQLYDNYMLESTWDQYKQKLVKDIVRKRSIHNNTTWEDIPYSLKTNSIRAGSLQESLDVKIE